MNAFAEVPKRGVARPSTAACELVEGTVLDGRYRLERRLARGATGSVWLARQQPLDRLVAVKVLDPKDAVAGTDLHARFASEAAALARLQHPSTVRIHDYGTWAGRPCLVMEHVDGFSLQRLLAGGAMPAARALDILVQVCDALQEAHGLGLVHGDLKPANLLIARRPGALDVVKVVDFGLVTDVHGAPRPATGTVAGTPLYLAPERVLEQGCSPQSDLYALGVLLFRMLTGHYPFEHAAAVRLFRAHVRDAPPTLAQAAPAVRLPPVLEWIVARCLEKQPSRRFASAAELRRALRVARLAVEDPAVAGVALTLRGGRVVLPRGLFETPGGEVVRLPGAPVTPRPGHAFAAVGLAILGVVGSWLGG